MPRNLEGEIEAVEHRLDVIREERIALMQEEQRLLERHAVLIGRATWRLIINEQAESESV